jgi:hypothetical protein
MRRRVIEFNERVKYVSLDDLRAWLYVYDSAIRTSSPKLAFALLADNCNAEAVNTYNAEFLRSDVGVFLLNLEQDPDFKDLLSLAKRDSKNRLLKDVYNWTLARYEQITRQGSISYQIPQP